MGTWNRDINSALECEGEIVGRLLQAALVKQKEWERIFQQKDTITKDMEDVLQETTKWQQWRFFCQRQEDLKLKAPVRVETEQDDRGQKLGMGSAILKPGDPWTW